MVKSLNSSRLSTDCIQQCSSSIQKRVHKASQTCSFPAQVYIVLCNVQLQLATGDLTYVTIALCFQATTVVGCTLANYT